MHAYLFRGVRIMSTN